MSAEGEDGGQAVSPARDEYLHPIAMMVAEPGAKPGVTLEDARLGVTLGQGIPGVGQALQMLHRENAFNLAPVA